MDNRTAPARGKENQMSITTTTRQDTMIADAALSIYPALYDGPANTLEGRIATAILHGKMTSGDRAALELLVDAATGVTSHLMDSDTAEKIRDATIEEAVQSALARPEGHILVDGRRVYVERR